MNATNERSYRKLLWTLVVLGACLDLGTKYFVFWRLGHEGHPDGRYDVVPDYFMLLVQYTHERESADGLLASLRTISSDRLPKVNHGALFGLAQEYEYIANGIFAGVSVLAAVAIAFWSTRRATATDWALCSALGLILAGTIGNLFDRIVFGGVRDFLYFYYINWPVFNVADCCLVCGAGFLLVQAFWAQPAPADQGLLAPELSQAK